MGLVEATENTLTEASDVEFTTRTVNKRLPLHISFITLSDGTHTVMKL